MKKTHWEIAGGIAFVLGGTFVAYNLLSEYESFWSAQNLWGIVMLACWLAVSFGYWHQGIMIHRARTSANVSLALPVAVFLVQCTLFVKGIYYDDMALVIGALLVNSAVVFVIYNIWKHSRA